jgi:hypothetical protein
MVERDLSQNHDYIRVRTNVQFRRASRPERWHIHMDEAFQGIWLTQEDELEYYLSGAPELLRCVAPYDVTIRVTVTRLVERHDDFGDDYYFGYRCGFGSYCGYNEERFSASATSRVELEGILEG